MHIKSGHRYMGVDELPGLLEKLDDELKKTRHSDTLDHFKVKRNDLPAKPELYQSNSHLEQQFRNLSATSLMRINNFINSNLTIFAEIGEKNSTGIGVVFYAGSFYSSRKCISYFLRTVFFFLDIEKPIFILSSKTKKGWNRI